MSLIKKTAASLALVSLTSGILVNGASAYSASEVNAAEVLAAKGIVVKQTNAADYQLDRQVLRQEIAAVSRGLASLEKTSSCTNVFNDVSATKPNTWACYTVEALANAGLIAKNATFRPESNITKAEAVGMVVKARYGNEYSPVAGNGTWEKQVVDFAVSKGIVSNFTNYTTPATRGFVFEVAANTYKNDTADNVICSLLGTCSTNEVKKDDKTNNVVRNDSNLAVALSPESPANGMVVANTPRAQLLAFTVTAGKSDVTLKKASLKFTGLGDYKIVRDLEIYSNDVKQTKNTEATFNSKLTSDLSFDRNIVVKAGETKTLVVTATIDPKNSTYNQTVRVSLTGIEASSTVNGADLTGASLTPYSVSNKASVAIDSTKADGRLNIGEENPIYNFSVRETSKREDVVVKAVTFAEGSANGVDLDNLSNLVLTANNAKIDAKFTYQKSKIVASTNYTVKKGEKVNFALKGTVIDDLNKRLEIKLDSVYSIGATTQIAASYESTPNLVTTVKDVTGTGVNFTFNRTGSNEVSVDTTDVNIGDLTFVTTSDYVADLRVTVSGNTENGKNPTYRDLEIDGISWNKETANTYVFKDVSLNKGTTKLPLTVDITDKATDRNNLKFTVSVVKLEENTLGEKIQNINRIVNNTQLSKDVVVVASSFKLKTVKANNTKVVPEGNQQVVLYKGTIDLAGSENITLQNFKLDKENSSTVGNLDEYISGATLNIGGKTFNGDVNASNINFSSVYATIQGGSKGVQVLVTATLKDKDLTTLGTQALKVVPSDVSVSADNTKTVTTNLEKTVSTVVNLVKDTIIENATQSTNSLKDEVLAGSKGVELAAIKVKDTSADLYINKFVAKTTGDQTINGLTSALKNIRLMDGTTEVANGGYVVDNNSIRFDNFTLKQSGSERTLKIVADVAAISTAGGESSSFIGKIGFTNIVYTTSKSTSEQTNLRANGEVVSIVPVIVTYTASKQFTTTGNNEAVIKVTVDSGENKLSSLELSKLTFNKDLNIASLKVNNDSVRPAANNVKEVMLTKDIKGLTTFDINILLDGKDSDGAVILKDIKLNAKETTEAVAQEVTSSTTEVSLGSFSSNK